MTYCMGDDWAQVTRCPITISPISFQFQWDQISIRFEQQKVADEFGDWLVEAEKKVQHGFRTMRG